MKKCNYCGSFVENNANYCPNCGASINCSEVSGSEKSNHSVLGIVAFILSITLSAIGGLVCGIIDIKTNKNNKHSFSVAAIIISATRFVLAVILIILYSVFSFNLLNNSFYSIKNITDNLSSYHYYQDELDDILSSGNSKDSDDKANIVIKLPDEPLIINQYDFDNKLEITTEITDIEYNIIDNSYMDYVRIDFSFTSKMTKNDSDIERNYADVVYKLKDSSGVIVDTDTTMVGPMSVGDMMKGDFSTFEVKKGETYTLELEDYKFNITIHVKADKAQNSLSAFFLLVYLT